jgi:hypothetical protein
MLHKIPVDHNHYDKNDSSYANATTRTECGLTTAERQSSNRTTRNRCSISRVAKLSGTGRPSPLQMCWCIPLLLAFER